MESDLTPAQESYLAYVSRLEKQPRLRDRMLQMCWHLMFLATAVIIGLHGFRPTIVPHWLGNLTNFYAGVLVFFEFVVMVFMGLCFLLVIVEAPPKGGYNYTNLIVSAKLIKHHNNLINLAPIFMTSSLWRAINKVIARTLGAGLVLAMICDGKSILATLFLICWSSSIIYANLTKTAIRKTISWINDEQIGRLMDTPADLLAG